MIHLLIEIYFVQIYLKCVDFENGTYPLRLYIFSLLHNINQRHQFYYNSVKLPTYLYKMDAPIGFPGFLAEFKMRPHEKKFRKF